MAAKLQLYLSNNIDWMDNFMWNDTWVWKLTKLTEAKRAVTVSNMSAASNTEGAKILNKTHNRNQGQQLQV